MSIKPTSVPPKSLYQSITSASTSFKLNNILSWDGVTNLTSADFGSQAFGCFLSADRSRIEFFEFDPATIASASITMLNRGLPPTGSVTPSASLKLDWTANDTTVLIGTDTPQFLMQLAFLASNNAFTGYNTVPDPLAATDIANKQWVLSVVNGGAVSFNQMIEAGTAGETLVAGNLVYFSETENEWMKTDADTLATLFNVKLGIAMGAGVNGGVITGGVLTRGSYTTSGLTQGDLCYASNTAGGINSGTSGTNPRVIGIAKDSTTLYFDPDFQNTLYDYAVDSVGTDAYAVTMPGALSVPFVGMEINFKAGTANTGACTLAVNGGSAKSIYKNVSEELVTGDIIANQIVKVVYDGTNFQVLSKLGSVNPVVINYGAKKGSSTSQFDITNPSGTTFRYTYDGTGTDPVINATTFPIGYSVLILTQSQNSLYFNINNQGKFTITGSGNNYFEVTNASGVIESNKILGPNSGLSVYNPTWTKTAGLKYIIVKVQGGGGGSGGTTTAQKATSGGGGGAYCEKLIPAASLGSTETVSIGFGGLGGAGSTASTGATGGTSSFGSHCSALGGVGGTSENNALGGIGGTASGGDINIQGGGGGASCSNATTATAGIGGSSILGGTQYSGTNDNDGAVGCLYGGGASGTMSSAGADRDGYTGAYGNIIITEYY